MRSSELKVMVQMRPHLTIGQSFQFTIQSWRAMTSGRCATYIHSDTSARARTVLMGLAQCAVKISSRVKVMPQATQAWSVQLRKWMAGAFDHAEKNASGRIINVRKGS